MTRTCAAWARGVGMGDIAKSRVPPRDDPTPPARTIPVRIALPPMLLAVALLAPSRLDAQCSFGGTPLYKGCFGIGWEGCCTYKETQLGTITTLQWCEGGYLCSLICNPFTLDTYVCGWVTDPYSGAGLYDCTSEQTQDPSGTFPYFCDIPCGGVTPEGCCEGKTLLKFCKNGSLNLINCAANSEGYRYCGWDPVVQAYSCTLAAVEGPAAHPYACGAPACTPACAGKQCGPDGCGGSCGSCPAGQVCGAAGACAPGACQPDCAGKDCGPDGCGGSCGLCGGTLACNASQKCVGPPCVPDCANKQCGPDLCGGSCGVCPPPKECSVHFRCIHPGEDVPLIPESLADAHVVQAPEADGGIPPATPEGQGSPQGAGRVCPEGTTWSYGQCVVPPPSPQVPATPGSAGGCRAARGAGALPGIACPIGLAWILFGACQRRRP